MNVLGVVSPTLLYILLILAIAVFKEKLILFLKNSKLSFERRHFI